MKGDFTRFSDDPSKHYSDVLQQQGRVQLDADWNAQRAIDRGRLRADTMAVVGAAGVPWADPGFAILPTADGRGLTIGVGTLYVGGVLCRNDAALALDAQPNAPGQALPSAAGRFLVYLDVWDRHVTALQDPALRDPALGGPDTTTRIQTLWQVRTLAVDANATGDAFGPGWAPPGAASTGTLMAATATATAPATGGVPVILPPTAGYRGLANQLYRVEIHTGGTLGGTPSPTFKWSRDNGAVAAAVAAVSGQTITVVGDATPFLGCWIELVRPEDELGGVAGPLLAVAAQANPGGALSIEPATPMPAWAATEPVLTIRRWDQPPTAGTAAGIAMGTAAIALEAGISITFGAGTCQAGDYWTVPARSAISAETGGILWAGGAVPARSIAHRYSPLALVDAAGSPLSFERVDDCRAGFVSRSGAPAPIRFYLQRGGQWTPVARDADVPLDALQAGILLGAAAPLRPTAVPDGLIRLSIDVPMTIQEPTGTTQLGIPLYAAAVAGTRLLNLPVSVSPGPASNQLLLTPNLIALELLLDLLASNWVAGTPLAAGFDLVPPSRAWSLNWDRSLTGVSPAALSDEVLIAVPLQPVGGNVWRIEGEFIQEWGISGGAHLGLVFNYRAADDYWAFCLDREVGESATGGGGTTIIRFTLKHADAIVATVSIDDIEDGLPLVLAITYDPGSRLNFTYTTAPGEATESTSPVDFASAQTVQAAPSAIGAGTRVGILSSGPATTVRRLSWQQLGAPAIEPIPFGDRPAVPARLVVSGQGLMNVISADERAPLRVAPIADTAFMFNVSAPLRQADYAYSGYGEIFEGFGSDLLQAGIAAHKDGRP
jgi:hypothetical protein